ncbi:hypothetical protein MJM43_32270, partial [Salmonella enterica subsp. enterica serovar Montevideo]|nr:hypothetical protein [Salmonella enterica subsp. enterica serovar Montevideo]
ALFIGLMIAIAVLCSWVGALCWNIASQKLPTVILGPLIVFETGIDIQHFDVNGKMALSAKTTTSERLHGILLMTESTSREKASP